MSYKITLQQIMRAVPTANRERATEFVNTFNENCEKFGINTTQRVVHFLAQVTTESNKFNAVEENLNYSADGLRKTFPKYFPTAALAQQYARQPQKIASRVYANRMGNGNEASGDGWKYRGRGMIQLTGKEQYRAYQNSGFCNGQLIYHPEWLTKSPGHTKSAMWYWVSRNLNALADMDHGDGIKGEDIVKKITIKVNGGYNGLSNRLYYYRRYKREFGL